MHQHITYNEWLPIVLGRRVLDIFELRLSPRGYYEGYNETVNPTVSNAFASAAFRFGHSLVKNTLSRCNKEFREVPYFVRLHKELNNPSNLHNFGSVDRIMLGLASKKLARRDEFITTELTNHLFQVWVDESERTFASVTKKTRIIAFRIHALPSAWTLPPLTFSGAATTAWPPTMSGGSSVGCSDSAASPR